MAGFEYSYDDSRLQALFDQLDEKKQVQALKGGFRRTANNFRKAVIHNLRGSIRSDADLEKGVRAIVFKRQPGFRVTVGTSGKKKGFHLNRFGLLKPVLLWAEDGTETRWTKSNGGRHTRMFSRRKRKGHTTGTMKAYKFMARTKEEQAAKVSVDLQNQIRKNVEATAKRCGCIV